jgi:peptidoglycan/LPS O-acetylase OafA/YrhL
MYPFGPLGERLQNVDMMRGSAATTVMFAHAALLGGNVITPLVADVPSLLSHLGSTAVWLFFVVSGFVISRPFIRSLLHGSPRPGMRSYAIRRMARIYPVYWVCALVTVVAVGWAGAGAVSKIAHVLLLHNVIPGRQHAFIPVSWTLTLEVLFYAAVPIGAMVLRWSTGGSRIGADRLAAYLLLGWGAVIAYLGAVPFFVEDPTRQLWMRGSFPAMIGMFVPGMLLAVATSAVPASRIARVWSWLRHRPGLLTAGALVGCALGATFASIDVPTQSASGRLVAWDLGRHAYAIGYGLLIARVAVASTWSFPGVGALKALGDMSYGVYLIHGTLLIVLLDSPSLIPLPEPGLGNYLLHVLFLSAITVPLAALSWRLLEKPLSDRARALTVRPEPVASTTAVVRPV